MSRKIFLFFLFLALIPAAISISIDTDKPDYSSGDLVTATVTGCGEGSITFVRFINSGGILVDLHQGTITEGKFSATYDTDSDPSEGTYNVKATCTGSDEEVTKNFCVDTTCTKADTPADTGTTGGTGGGTSKKYQCNDKIDNDKDGKIDFPNDPGCTSKNDNEEKDSLVCKESWVCTEWTDCKNEKQTRTCADEKKCGTTIIKPGTSITCKTDKVIPPPQQTKKPSLQQPEGGFPWIITILIVSIVIIAGALLYFLVIRKRPPHDTVYSPVRNYMRNAQKEGYTRQEIEQSLLNKGWKKEVVDQQFQQI
ncbi:hypothetical protein HOC13_00555 [Candidatus Woesearchaeota archaeon]|jgi:hypothetical protein|nr:hypothetical protein [Candidatus Woesearchaeota archaeon]